MAAHHTNDDQVVRRAVFWRLRVANVLTDCFRIRKQLLGHLIIDDRDRRRIFVFGFGLSKIATAQEFYADGVEVTGCRCRKQRRNTGIGHLWIGRQCFPHGHDATRIGEIAVRYHSGERGALDTG